MRGIPKAVANGDVHLRIGMHAMQQIGLAKLLNHASLLVFFARPCYSE